MGVNRIGWTRLVQFSRGRKAKDPGGTGLLWILSNHRDYGACLSLVAYCKSPGALTNLMPGPHPGDSDLIDLGAQSGCLDSLKPPGDSLVGSKARGTVLGLVGGQHPQKEIAIPKASSSAPRTSHGNIT